jgi:hypothetical protein
METSMNGNSWPTGSMTPSKEQAHVSGMQDRVQADDTQHAAHPFGGSAHSLAQDHHW